MDKNIQNLLSTRKILLPILIGLGVVTYMFIKGFNADAFMNIRWSWKATLWIFLACVMMFMRDLAYMWRIRILTNNKFSWRKALDVILLWEFASAATPSVVGGSAVALFILNKENISAGKSTTIVLFTTVLDELFFIVIAPICFILAGKNLVFPDLDHPNISHLATEVKDINTLIYFLIFGYIVLLAYTLFVSYGLFLNPRGIRWVIIKLFSNKLLRKWRPAAVQMGLDIMSSSKELQNQNASFWFKAILSTVLSWSARYLVINCIIMAFAPVDNHFIVYARQVVMWIIMLVTPTPGGSGMAEFVFSTLLAEYIPKGLEASLALIWRIISYYPYLFIGVILLPRWLRRVYGITNQK